MSTCKQILKKARKLVFESTKKKNEDGVKVVKKEEDCDAKSVSLKVKEST